jgi:hypothetical protein
VLVCSPGRLAAAQAPPKAPPGASIDAHLEALGRGDARGPLRVDEGELNAWLGRPGTLPLGVERVAVSIARESVRIAGVVEAERYVDQLPPSVAAIASLISGPLPVALEARLETEAGQGRLHVDALSIAGMPFPVSLIAPIVAALTRSASQPEGFDVTQPFVLPGAIDRVRLDPGVAWLDVRPPPGPSP